ncbi:MAG: TonB-dependent receptor [Sulfurospirillum cavolei]|nr:TonB-dependent receptor [Sulfurospirillum cavolei]
MKKQVQAAFVLSLVAACTLHGEDSYTLGEVVATGKTGSATAFETQSKENINSQGYNKDAIELYSGPIGMSALKVVGMSPSVDYQPAEVFGSNETSFHDPLRIRGKSQSGPGGVYMLESLPISGNPGGGKTMFDLENIAWIDLYKGYMPADKSLGFSNLIGKVDMIVDRPKKEMETTVSQTVGSDNALRTFLRFDTGQMGDVSAFGSVSKTTGDKWKGEGDLDRTNVMLGMTYTPNDNFKSELFFVHSEDDHHNYYSLSYAEAKNLDMYSKKDWNTAYPTTKNANYYDWNRQSFTDDVVTANFEYRFANDSVLSFKPYYSKDKGEYWFTNTPTSPTTSPVTQWLIDHERYGAVLAYEIPIIEEMAMKIGYWYGKQDLPGPPTSRRVYGVTSTGALKYNGWGMLAEESSHKFSSPFVQLSGDINDFSYAFGLRYLDFTLAKINSYSANATGSTISSDYDTALGQIPLDPWSSVASKNFTEWLPSAYLGYKLTPNTEIYFDYGRSYGYDVNLFPSYISGRATYVGKHVTLQQLWDKQELEISDNFDIGLKYKVGDIVLAPNLFYTKVSGKQATVYDTQYGVKYPTNSIDAASYGAEFAISGALSEHFDFLASAFYNRYYYTDEFQTTATATTSIKNNQVPDAPMHGLKGSMTYKIGSWKFTPIVRYTASRYGTVDHTEEIPSFTTVDFNVDYKLPKIQGFKEGNVQLNLVNLLDREYIASIITPDNALSADGVTTSYLTGAPFGAYVSVTLKF